jgi:hypothetical protein
MLVVADGLAQSGKLLSPPDVVQFEDVARPVPKDNESWCACTRRPSARQIHASETARLIRERYPVKRRRFLSHLAVVAGATLTQNLTESSAQTRRLTQIAIDRTQFLINGQLTYKGRVWRGNKIEGLLMNARLVQGIFDDLNPDTLNRWAYPDTQRWDPERNTREFIAAMAEWRRHGLLGFTVNLQGGSPEGYSQNQQWHNSAFESDGSLRPAYLNRLARILDRADELGMVAIVGYFYFGQDERLKDEAAVLRGTRDATEWLLSKGYTNVLVEVANECDVARYDHAILRAPRIHELISLVRETSGRDRSHLLVGTSFGGASVPTANVVAASDFLLIHGNGVTDPARIGAMVEETRNVRGYRPMPILFNEDDHFDFERPVNNCTQAISRYASWGYFDPGMSNYKDGYQCPPINWTINTPRKKAFFDLLKEITGTTG